MTRKFTLLNFYEHVYRPARHAGPRHRRTRSETRSVINNFNRWWTAFCAETGRPLSTVTLTVFDLHGDDAVTMAMAWLVDDARNPGRAPATANKLRATINAIWRAAHERGLVRAAPRSKRYRCDHEDPIALTPDQKRALIRQAQRVQGTVGEVVARDWWTMLVLLLLNTGARITVAYESPTTNLDVSRGELLLPARFQKQRKDQRVALWGSTMRAIRRVGVVERRMARVLGDFPGNVDTLRDHYTRLVLEPAGLPVTAKHKFHCLRRTLASEVAAADSVGTAQQILGHSSAAVTLRYIDPRYEQRPRVPDLVPDPLPHDAGPQLSVFRTDAG